MHSWRCPHVCLQTVMISVEHLGRLITPSQLTDDLHGTLPYDNQEWVEIRMVRG